MPGSFVENLATVNSLPKRSRSQSGRLLSEFLVGLAILFLALSADMAVLNKATESTTEAVLSDKALEIARLGMEEAIEDPSLLASGPVHKTFGTGRNKRYEATFIRSVWKTSLSPHQAGISRVIVKVEWDDGTHDLRLERYVRAN